MALLFRAPHCVPVPPHWSGQMGRSQAGHLRDPGENPVPVEHQAKYERGGRQKTTTVHLSQLGCSAPGNDGLTAVVPNELRLSGVMPTIANESICKIYIVAFVDPKYPNITSSWVLLLRSYTTCWCLV